jgi:hypothetical protein
VTTTSGGELEFFETPRAFTRYLAWYLAKIGKPIHGKLFEPCVGSRAILKAFETPMYPAIPLQSDAWQTNDIDYRFLDSCDTMIDAGSTELWEKARAYEDGIDWTISNPPFGPWLEICDHAITYSDVGVAMHLRASVHEVLKTGARRTWFGAHRPTGILYLPRFAYQRSKTTGRWTTDNMGACWVIWLARPKTGSAGGDHAQFIDYAPEWVIDELDAETPAYRARIDALMGRQKTKCDCGGT